VRDISDRKQREQRLEEFASVVSHDLRNPLNVIRGRLEAARETGDLSHLEPAEASVDRMYRLIDDLLSLAQQGETVGEMESVDVDTVVKQAWEHVATDDATIRIEDSTTVEADPDRLNELLENLIRNAVEHGPTRGQAVSDAGGGTQDGAAVTVRVGSLSTSTGFYVADDGTGIQADDPEQVFEHGYSERDHGTGFGLSIVERVAEAHGWSVRVTESWAGGARFEVDVEG
jgi:signal transduction histidine kinase